MARKARAGNVVAETPPQAVVQSERVRHRTEPIPGTLTDIPGYPKRLKVYKLDASPYWWMRMFHKGKIYRRSTKTEVRREAFAIARAFFSEIESGNYVKPQPKEDKMTFAKVAAAYLKAQEAKVARKKLTKMTFKNTRYRLDKTILPTLGAREIASIHFDDLNELLDELSHDDLSGSTISAYMKITKSVLTHAYQQRHVTSIPPFPKVEGDHEQRGYFTNKEYRRLWSRARSLVGKRFEYRKLPDANGNELQGQYLAEGECNEGRLIRKTTITRELSELIVFMVNSYCRPTDIKNLQHKHVTVVRGERTYLRLNPPPTKGHDDPFVTMKQAVSVYERLTTYNKSIGRDTGPEAYVFFPNYIQRDYALKELMRQFAVLMWNLNMGTGPKGERRTMYSLRHTCFMFRVLYGEGMHDRTLAANGRTSVEMIEKHYTKPLHGEQNIDMLQSRRKRHPKREKQQAEAP